MASQGATTRPLPRSSRASTSSQPSRRRGRDATTPSRDMDLDSIRTRRARLQALTASIRLPPLTPVDVLGTHPASVYNNTSHRSLPSGERHLRLQQKANLPTSATSVRAQSGSTKLPALSLPPMTPYHDPLPEIGHAKEQIEKKAGDENQLGDTRVESSPPPTYEETLKVSHWVEEISQEAKVETLTSLKSLEKQEPSPASLAAATEDPSRSTSTAENHPETAKPVVEESEDECKTVERDKADFIKIVSDMGSEVLQTQVEATIMARKLLSEISNPPIDEFLHADILTPALDNLQQENDILLFETVWVITNIASGCSVQTKALVDRGFIEPLVQLLNSNKASVQEQVTWAIGNIAGDGPELRNIVVAAGIIKPLVALVTQETTQSFLRNIAWTLSNIFRTKNLEMPEDEKTLVLQAMKEHLLPHHDNEVHVDALWTVGYYTDMGNNYIQQVVDAGMIPLLVKHLHSSEVRVVSPALRAVGNIVSGTDAQTDAVLEAEVLPIFLHLLTNPKADIRKQTAWSLSNILAGTHSQIQMVIDADIIPALVELAKEDEFHVQKEVIWGFANMAEGGSKAQIEVLVSSGGLQQLVTILSIFDTKLKVLGTKGIMNILKVSDGDNSVKEIIVECGGLEILEDNLYHENSEISGNITEILNYFQDLQEENDNRNQEKEQILPEKASKYVADLILE